MVIVAPQGQAHGQADVARFIDQVRAQLAGQAAHDAKAQPPQVGGPAAIVFGLVEMLSTVELDDQVGFDAQEVGDEGASRNLPPPLPAA